MFTDWNYAKEGFVYDLIDDGNESFEAVSEKFKKEFKQEITAADVEFKYRLLKGEKVNYALISKKYSKASSNPKPTNETSKNAKFQETISHKNGRKKSLSPTKRKKLITEITTGIEKGVSPTNMAKSLANKYGLNWSTLYSEYKDYLASTNEHPEPTNKKEPITIPVNIDNQGLNTLDIKEEQNVANKEVPPSPIKVEETIKNEEKVESLNKELQNSDKLVELISKAFSKSLEESLKPILSELQNLNSKFDSLDKSSEEVAIFKKAASEFSSAIQKIIK